MNLAGTIQNGVVILDDGTQLPDGTRVEVIVRAAPSQGPTLAERLLALAGKIDDLPPDMAENHDHYIHGTPRR